MDQIMNEFIKCLYENDWAIYEENSKYHISTACLTTNESLKSSIIDLLADWIEKIQPASIICISEGMDEAIFTLTTWISLKLGKPFYTYNLDEPRNPLIIESNISDCTLLLPYTYGENQILENLKFIENLGGYIKQIIVVVNESENIRKICENKKIDLVEFFSILEIINKLTKIDSPKSQKIVSQLIQNHI